MSAVTKENDSKDEIVSSEDANGIQTGNSSSTTDLDLRMISLGNDSNAGLDHDLEKSYRDIIEEHNLNGGEDEEEQSIELQLVPPDQRTGDLLLAAVVEPEIEEDTEAAEALRANAQIKVGKVSKAARGINAQTVRKLVKIASLRGLSGKRGKPPRVPPGLISPGQHLQQHPDHLVRVAEENQIYAVEEGDNESDHLEENDQASKADHDSSAFSTPGAFGEKSVRINYDDSKVVEKEPTKSQSQRSDQHAPLGEAEPSFKPGKGHISFGNSTIFHDHEGDIPEKVDAATMDVGRKLMGGLDHHNIAQLQKWKKKKRGEKKNRKSYVKGKVIDGRHELYTLSIAVMLGVRTSIARTNTIISSCDGGGKKILSPQDFMAEEKYEFSPKGSPTTPPHKLSHTFKFKDYAPVAFAYLRRMFGVNEFDFLLSVCGNANFIEFISNAKSGQFFFYSSDGKYMIKTMTNSESKFLRRILPHYFRHCTENPNTILAKFLGMYRVKLYHLRRNVKFIIMNSVYYTDKSIQTFFDLKGSELGRSAKPGQDVWKDNDLRKNLKEDAFSFCPEVRRRYRAQIELDCNFLRKMQIMDYSMLIGIHHIPPRKVNTTSNIADTGFKIQEHRSTRTPSRRNIITDKENGVSDNTLKGSGRSVGSGHDHSKDATHLESFHDSAVGNDSTKNIIRDIKETAHSTFEFSGLLEDEDDCSYLEGSENYLKHAAKAHINKHHPTYRDSEKKKEQTIEQIYWPFHKFYDINGYRRLKPKQCSAVGDEVSELIKAWNIPEFVTPLSDRKDGGVMMDTSHLKTPMSYHGKQGEMAYEGKIYYLGIIDILQQYNVRKRIETKYRKWEVRGKEEPSCVSPDDYAERFVLFFDQYSQKAHPKPYLEKEATEI